jgi:uncharacterized protein (DUF952 family)
MSKRIYHITEKENWEAQKSKDSYTHPSLIQEGFIHCSKKEQIEGVITRYYQNMNNLLLLHIDETLLNAPLKYEMAPIGEVFPHIFGAINKEAIVKTEKI